MNTHAITQTNGKNSDGMAFCAECHAAAGPSQAFFLPQEYRVGN